MSGVVAGLIGSVKKAIAVITTTFYAIRFNNTETGLRGRQEQFIGYDKNTSSMFHLQPTANTSNSYLDSWRLISRNYNTGAINWVKKITPDGDFFGVNPDYQYSWKLYPYPLGVRNSKIFVGMSNYYDWRIVAFNLDGTVFASKEFLSSVTTNTPTIDDSFNVYIPVYDSTWEVGKGSYTSTMSLVAYNFVTGTKVSNSAGPQRGVANSRNSSATPPTVNASGDKFWQEGYTHEYGYFVLKNFLLRNGASQALESSIISEAGYVLTDNSIVLARRIDYITKIDGNSFVVYRTQFIQNEFSQANLTTCNVYYTIFSFLTGSGVPANNATLSLADGDYGYVLHNFSTNSNTIYLAKTNLKTGEIYWQKRLTITTTSGSGPYVYSATLDPNKNLVFRVGLSSSNPGDPNYSVLDYVVFNSDGSNMTGAKTFGSYTFTFVNLNFLTLDSASSNLNQSLGSPVSLRTPTTNFTVGNYSKTPQLVDKTAVYTETKETI
jgi:hypothetical protein